MECPQPSELIAIAANDVSDMQPILTKCFRMDANGEISFHNRYYSIVTPVRIYTAAQILSASSSDGFCKALETAPALSLISSTARGNAVATCKQVWTKLSPFCKETAVVIMFIDDSFSSESEMDELVDWGVNNNIEVVTRALCEEEGTEVAARLERALECANWPQVSSSHAALGLTLEQPSNEQAESTDDDCEQNAVPGDTVLPPTRLRRALNNTDVSMLTNELLLLGESDSDTSASTDSLT